MYTHAMPTIEMMGRNTKQIINTVRYHLANGTITGHFYSRKRKEEGVAVTMRGKGAREYDGDEKSTTEEGNPQRSRAWVWVIGLFNETGACTQVSSGQLH